MLNELEKSQLAVAQGAYGRFIVSSQSDDPPILKNPPIHWLSSASRASRLSSSSKNWGSAVVTLAPMGRECAELQHEFGLSETSHLAAVLIYGKPAPSQQQKNINQSFRSLIGSRKRKLIDHIFLEPILQDIRLPDKWEAIMEAGRWSPSATNAQPWRLTAHRWRISTLHQPGCIPDCAHRWQQTHVCPL